MRILNGRMAENPRNGVQKIVFLTEVNFKYYSPNNVESQGFPSVQKYLSNLN